MDGGGDDAALVGTQAGAHIAEKGGREGPSVPILANDVLPSRPSMRQQSRKNGN